MRTVALTGGIASGKSTVARMFTDLGAKGFSADADAWAVLEPGSPVLEQVLAAFPQARRPDGALDRSALGQQIFGDEDARKRLNSLMHPAIRVRMRAAIEAARSSAEPGVLLYEVPLLYEGGLETWFDEVVAVLATPEKQAERLQARERDAGRPLLSPEQIAERLSAQLPPEEKARRADHVIHTDTSLEATRSEVERLWRQWQTGD